MGNKEEFKPGSVQGLVLFQKLEDFMLYFEPIVERFPTREKSALCAMIKRRMYHALETIISTNRSKQKLAGWYSVDTDLEILRFYVRFAYKRKYLCSRSYENTSKLLLELGRIVGGLINKRDA
jgi:hypothetical protein